MDIVPVAQGRAVGAVEVQVDRLVDPVDQVDQQTAAGTDPQHRAAVLAVEDVAVQGHPVDDHVLRFRDQGHRHVQTPGRHLRQGSEVPGYWSCRGVCAGRGGGEARKAHGQDQTGRPGREAPGRMN